MTIKTNYYDDHTYYSQDLVNEKASLFTDGVCGVSSGAFLVSANSPADLSVDVAIGGATVNGFYIDSDGITNVPIVANTSGYNRIDIIVLDVDTSGELTTLISVEGTPSSSPIAPLPTAFQLVLAQVAVGNNVSVIDQVNITDERVNVDLCGQLALRPTKTTIALTYYVNTTLGNDNNLGLAVGAGAFKTIGKAVSMIPQIINHTISINVADGTYAETVSLSGFVGSGYIYLTGNSGTPANVIVNIINVTHVTCGLSINGFRLSTTTVNAMTITTSIGIVIANMSIIASALTFVAIYFNHSKGRVQNSIISNHQDAIYANYESNVFSDTNSGTLNTIGLCSLNGSTITKSGIQPAGTTNEYTIYGSSIYNILADCTIADITYYVNNASGNDGNSGLASGAGAFATIGKAISMIPQIVNHTVTINIADGTYQEGVLPNGFMGNGSLYITGNVATRTNVLIQYALIQNCSIPIIVSGARFFSTAYHGFAVHRCNSVSAISLSINGSTGSKLGYAYYDSRGVVQTCDVSNHQRGIQSDNSDILSIGNSGTLNVVGLYATNGGRISKSGTQPSGTDAETQYNSGRILSDNVISLLAANGYRYNDDGSIDQWMTITLPADTSSHTFTLPIAFPTGILNAQVTILDAANASADSACRLIQMNAASVVVANSQASAREATVRAIGY
jgi:hypothetical protein